MYTGKFDPGSCSHNVIPSWLLGRNFYRYGNDFLIFIIEASLDAWRHWTQANLGSQNSVVQALFIFTLDIESSHKFSRPKKRMMWPVKYMTKFMRTLFRKLMPLTMGSVNAMGSQGNTVYFLLSNVHTRKKIAWSQRSMITLWKTSPVPAWILLNQPGWSVGYWTQCEINLLCSVPFYLFCNKICIRASQDYVFVNGTG